MADIIKFDLGNILDRINRTEMPERAVAKATASKPKAKADVPKPTVKETKPKAVAKKRTDEEIDKTVGLIHTLTNLPANDGNYALALNKATKEELEEAIRIMKTNGGRNKMRIKKCEEKLAEFHGAEIREKMLKKKPKAESKAEEKPKVKIIQFPKERPTIELAEPTNEGHTYEECEAKLLKEREVWKDADSQFVIDGLLKECKENPIFRDNVMREDKSYAGAFDYFADLAKQGFAVKYGNVTYLDNEMALEYAINYFNKKD